MSDQRKGPLNYTTVVDPAKSAAECVARLAQHGATAIGMTYDKGFPTGLSFQILTQWGPRQFSLPVNVDGTKRALDKAWRERRIPQSKATRDQAERTSWRVLKDWLEAQLALVEAGVADLPQVMLPYLHVDHGVTLWQRYLENEQLALTAGTDG